MPMCRGMLLAILKLGSQGWLRRAPGKKASDGYSENQNSQLVHGGCRLCRGRRAHRVRSRGCHGVVAPGAVCRIRARSADGAFVGASLGSSLPDERSLGPGMAADLASSCLLTPEGKGKPRLRSLVDKMFAVIP